MKDKDQSNQDESAKIDDKVVNDFIKNLTEWGEKLSFKERTILQLLLSSIDPKVTQELAAGNSIVRDIPTAARNGLSGIFALPGSVLVKPGDVSSWMRGGPLWARWSSKAGSMFINPIDQVKK